MGRALWASNPRCSCGYNPSTTQRWGDSGGDCRVKVFDYAGWRLETVPSYSRAAAARVNGVGAALVREGMVPAWA